MIQFPRKTLYQFGSAQPSNATAVVGSQAAGAVAYTTDLVTMQTGGGAGPTTQWANGMVGAAGPLIGNGSPTAPDFNALWQLALNQAAYLLQQGVPAWDAATTYYPGNFCAYPPNDAVNANIYLGQSANNTGNNPGTDGGTNWLPWLNVVKSPKIIPAWASFDGTGSVGLCPIHSSIGIDSIDKLATGKYQINFTAGTLGNSNYGIFGGPGENNGVTNTTRNGAFITDNLINGPATVKTASTLVIYCIGGTPGVPVDATAITIGILSVN